MKRSDILKILEEYLWITGIVPINEPNEILTLLEENGMYPVKLDDNKSVMSLDWEPENE